MNDITIDQWIMLVITILVAIGFGVVCVWDFIKAIGRKTDVGDKNE